MNKNAGILNEILIGEWLMSPSHLLQIGHFMQTVVTSGVENERKKEDAISCLSFFNDDLQKIYPREVSEIPTGSIAVIDCVGPIMKYWSWWFVGADEIVAQLDFANSLENIEAIVLRIDGPGGAVSAISPFIDFASRKQKPLVALCDASLSLHRWIPDAVADYQMADNDISARFGSVGVVSTWTDATKYYEAMGVVMEEVYPKESEHKNEIWRLYKDDPDAAKKMLRDMHLSPMAIKFQEAVKAAHPNLLEEEGVLSGRTFTAEDAVRIGMINGIGNLQEAMRIAQSLSEMSAIEN